MKNWLCTLVLLLSTSALADGPNMEELIKLGAGYHAKNMCTCLFVVGQPMDFCKDMTKTKPNIDEFGGKYVVDEAGKTVTADAVVVKAVAAFNGDKQGCTLTPAAISGQ